MTPKGKLELTWVNKDERPRLEPRILVEEGELSYGDPNAANMLIHGNNLLALKALEQDFAGEIQCIYIDPPFNTKQAFTNYDDGLEHSIWLTLMRDRLETLHTLLHESGTLFIHIDDNELAYSTVLADEIFVRKNRIAICTFKQSSTSGPKAINPGMVTTSNFILVYAKDKSHWKSRKVVIPTKRDDRYNHYITNYSDNYSEWKFDTLRNSFAATHGVKASRLRQEFGDTLDEMLEKFVLENAERVTRLARVSPEDVNVEARVFLEQSREAPDKVFKVGREDRDDYYFINGEQLLFYSSKVKEIDGRLVTGPLVRLALLTGMRRGELLRMRWDAHVNFERGEVYATNTKTGRDRAISMSDECHRLLIEMRATATGDFLFMYNGKPLGNPSSAFKAACAEAGITNLCFHDLRHTFATRLGDASASMADIAALLGHSQISMSARYTHATEQGKRRAVAALDTRRDQVLVTTAFPARTGT